MDCFGTYFTHVQTCDNDRVQSAIRNGLLRYILYTSKPVITFVFKMLRNGLLPYMLYTCPNLWQRSCSKCYTQWTALVHTLRIQTCDKVRVPSATQWIASAHTLNMSKTCHNLRVPNATQWTASVHTLHMSKPVITFVFKVLRNGLLPYMLYTCPNLW